jgi:hypothetical protein
MFHQKLDTKCKQFHGITSQKLWFISVSYLLAKSPREFPGSVIVFVCRLNSVGLPALPSSGDANQYSQEQSCSHPAFID